MTSQCLDKIMIIGNVGKEPRFFSTKSGSPICTFSVATNRSWIPKGPTERKEETQWHYIVTFNKLAEICDRILTKSTKVFISGRIQTREFTNLEDKKVRKIEIVASNVIALDKRRLKGVING